jgi:hypothetical protein
LYTLIAANRVNMATKDQEQKPSPTYYADLLGGSNVVKVTNIVSGVLPFGAHISIIDTDVHGGDRLCVRRSWLGSRSVAVLVLVLVLVVLTARNIQI